MCQNVTNLSRWKYIHQLNILCKILQREVKEITHYVVLLNSLNILNILTEIELILRKKVYGYVSVTISNIKN